MSDKRCKFSSFKIIQQNQGLAAPVHLYDLRSEQQRLLSHPPLHGGIQPLAQQSAHHIRWPFNSSGTPSGLSDTGQGRWVRHRLGGGEARGPAGGGDECRVLQGCCVGEMVRGWAYRCTTRAQRGRTPAVVIGPGAAGVAGAQGSRP